MMSDNTFGKIFDQAIRSFSWSDYGFDLVEETLKDSGAQDWVRDLAIHLEQSIGDYINGRLDV